MEPIDAHDCTCSCEHCWPSSDNPHDDAGHARFCPRGHDHGPVATTTTQRRMPTEMRAFEPWC